MCLIVLEGTFKRMDTLSGKVTPPFFPPFSRGSTLTGKNFFVKSRTLFWKGILHRNAKTQKKSVPLYRIGRKKYGGVPTHRRNCSKVLKHWKNSLSQKYKLTGAL